MRTGQVAAALAAAGLLSLVLLASAPPASACSLLNDRTDCVMDIYKDQRARATAKAAGFQAWANVVPGKGLACPDVSAAPYDPQADIDHAEAFIASVMVPLVPPSIPPGPLTGQGGVLSSLAALVADTWFGAAEFALFVDQRATNLVAGLVPDPALVITQVVLDPQGYATAALEESAITAAEAQAAAQSTANCLATLPPPPI